MAAAFQRGSFPRSPLTNSSVLNAAEGGQQPGSSMDPDSLAERSKFFHTDVEMLGGGS
jgi:hypothetical protein